MTVISVLVVDSIVFSNPLYQYVYPATTLKSANYKSST